MLKYCIGCQNFPKYLNSFCEIKILFVQNYNEVSPHTSQNGHHQNLQTINAGEGVEKREPSCTVGGNVN